MRVWWYRASLSEAHGCLVVWVPRLILAKHSWGGRGRSGGGLVEDTAWDRLHPDPGADGTETVDRWTKGDGARRCTRRGRRRESEGTRWWDGRGGVRKTWDGTGIGMGEQESRRAGRQTGQELHGLVHVPRLTPAHVLAMRLPQLRSTCRGAASGEIRYLTGVAGPSTFPRIGT